MRYNCSSCFLKTFDRPIRTDFRRAALPSHNNSARGRRRSAAL